jgi:hypothetical protein
MCHSHELAKGKDRRIRQSISNKAVEIPIFIIVHEALFITQFPSDCLIFHQEIGCTGDSSWRGAKIHSNRVWILRWYVLVGCHCLSLMRISSQRTPTNPKF